MAENRPRTISVAFANLTPDNYSWSALGVHPEIWRNGSFLMYLSAVKLTRSLFWGAFVAGILALLFQNVIPWWLPVGLAICCARLLFS